MEKIGLFIWRLPRELMKGFVQLYRLIVSPYLPNSCRFTPTCSQYSIQAFEELGFIKGFILTIWRILRCNPWFGHGGYDPPKWFGADKD